MPQVFMMKYYILENKELGIHGFIKTIMAFLYGSTKRIEPYGWH